MTRRTPRLRRRGRRQAHDRREERHGGEPRRRDERQLHRGVPSVPPLCEVRRERAGLRLPKRLLAHAYRPRRVRPSGLPGTSLRRSSFFVSPRPRPCTSTRTCPRKHTSKILTDMCTTSRSELIQDNTFGTALFKITRSEQHIQNNTFGTTLFTICLSFIHSRHLHIHAHNSTTPVCSAHTYLATLAACLLAHSHVIPSNIHPRPSTHNAQNSSGRRG